MNKYLNISFIGGDQRQIRVISGFSQMGCNIKLFGFENAVFPPEVRVNFCETLRECIYNTDIVVLPLPYNVGTDKLNNTFSDNAIYVSDILSGISDKQILFAGRADNRLRALSELYNIQLIDYTEREELSVLNSIPTVEGALEIAISKTPYTLHGSRCIVLGYGRIGKLLANALDSLGSCVSVAARKYSDLAWIKAAGYTPIQFKNLEEHIGTYDIIFNTVPVTVLDYKMLSKIPDTSLIIDLASRPGGADFFFDKVFSTHFFSFVHHRRSCA